MKYCGVFLRRFLAALMVVSAVSSVMGCGGGKGNVGGTVTIDGQPLPAGKIAFVAAKISVEGEIVDGKYEVKGVPVGEVKVSVNTKAIHTQIEGLENTANAVRHDTPPPGLPENARQELEEQAKNAANSLAKAKELRAKYRPIPEAYSDPEKSNLRFNVTKGNNPAFDIALKSR